MCGSSSAYSTRHEDQEEQEGQIQGAGKGSSHRLLAGIASGPKGSLAVVLLQASERRRCAACCSDCRCPLHRRLS